MSDIFGAPAEKYYIVTPSDSVDNYFRSIRVGTTSGAVAVMRLDGTTVVVPGVLLGETVPIVGKRVLSTGTTAVGIMAYA